MLKKKMIFLAMIIASTWQVSLLAGDKAEGKRKIRSHTSTQKHRTVSVDSGSPKEGAAWKHKAAFYQAQLEQKLKVNQGADTIAILRRCLENDDAALLTPDSFAIETLPEKRDFVIIKTPTKRDKVVTIHK